MPSEPPAPTPGVWQILGGAGFVSPVGLAADREGNLYVADAASYHVYKLAADGSLLATGSDYSAALVWDLRPKPTGPPKPAANRA